MHPHENAFERLRSLQIDTILAGSELDSMRGRFDQIRNRHQNGTAPRAVSAFQLFQTPELIAARLVALLQLAPGARILEPSCGLGRVLDALAPFHPSEIVAVEKSTAIAAELYRQNRPRVTLKQRDFLSLTPAEIGTFDAIAMNPPFHMRDDIRHIRHALQFLRPGCLLSAICLSGPRREQELRPLASHWEILPAGTFAAEGTRVETVLMLIPAAYFPDYCTDSIG
jgi:SAM-dependent methyltransferase